MHPTFGEILSEEEAKELRYFLGNRNIIKKANTSEAKSLRLSGNEHTEVDLYMLLFRTDVPLLSLSESKAQGLRNQHTPDPTS